MYFIVSSFKTSWNSTPKLSEIWETGGSHPDNEMLIFHILPLNILIALGSLRKAVLNIGEFILDIRRPSDVSLIDAYLMAALLYQFEGVIEQTFCDKPTWNGRVGIFQNLVVQVLSLVLPEITNQDNWVAVLKFVWGLVLSI